MALITVVLQYYQNMILALSLCAILVGILAFVFYKQKRPWIYFYAIAFSVMMVLFMDGRAENKSIKFDPKGSFFMRLDFFDY